MGLSVTHLVVVLAIVTVVFGTKRLRNIGSDLGGAIKGFRSAIAEGEEVADEEGIGQKAGAISDAGGRATQGAVAEENKNKAKSFI